MLRSLLPARPIYEDLRKLHDFQCASQSYRLCTSPVRPRNLFHVKTPQLKYSSLFEMNFRNHDGDAEDNVEWKMKLYSQWLEIYSVCRIILLFPKPYFNNINLVPSGKFCCLHFFEHNVNIIAFLGCLANESGLDSFRSKISEKGQIEMMLNCINFAAYPPGLAQRGKLGAPGLIIRRRNADLALKTVNQNVRIFNF